MALIRQTILYLPAQIIAPAAQFASILLWALLLTPTDVGLVTTFAATQEICFAAFFGWWSLYVFRFIVGFDDDAARRAFLKTEAWAVAGSFVAEVIVLLPVLYLLDAKSPLSLETILLALAFISTRSLNTLGANRAMAEQRILLYSLIQIISTVGGVALGVICILLLGASADDALIGLTIAQGICILMNVAMSDLFHGFGRPSAAILKKAASFGGTQAASQMLAVAAMNAPRFVVVGTLGFAAAGMFAVGYTLGLRASSFAVMLVTASAYPLVVRKMQEEGAKAAFAQLSRNMVLVALVVAPVGLGLAAVSRSVTNLLVAPQFREVTYTVLPLATFGGVLRYLRAHTSDQVFLLYLKPHYGTIIAVCDLAIAVASAWLGARAMGAAGGALGPMISGAVTFVLSFTLARMIFGYRGPFGAFARILMAAAIMCAAILLLPVATNLFVLALQVVLGSLIYAIILAVIMPDERRQGLAILVRWSRRFGVRLA